jgi:hypothetical protein
MQACTSVAFADGHLIYWRDGNLVGQPFDPRRGIVAAQTQLFDLVFNWLAELNK